MKAIFFRESGAGYVLFALGLISLVLATLDSLTGLLTPLRSAVGTAVAPVHLIADSPYRASAAVGRVFATRNALQDDNDRLQRQLLILGQVAQQSRALRTENERLRALLGSQERLDTDVLITEIIGVVSDPRSQQVVIDKGQDAGVFVGQAVIDAEGLFGQVVAVEQVSARVVLVSDASHAVPIEISRNGVRGIAGGLGRVDALELESVPISTDILEGDLAVTSGLGGRFPRGYPVGSVESVVIEPGAAFAEIVLRPAAALDRSRHVLLVARGETELAPVGELQPESPGGAAEGSASNAAGEQP